MDPIKVISLMTPCAKGMSSGFVLKLLKEGILAGKMLKTWKTYFSIGMTMLGTLESTDKYDIYCH